MRDPASDSPDAVRRALDHFHALQTAMHETYSALPPDAQAAILRRSPQPHLPHQPPPPQASASAETTYLARRDAHARMMADSRYAERASRDAQRVERPINETRSWVSVAPSSSRSSSQQLQPPSTPQRSASPTPSTPIHRVYLLRCAHCETFLSDRGMRAVLLLKPNIILFSTDASPCNAGPLWPESRGEEPGPERTCDCLTSSLACHGCGTTVGYHIVSPCTRCTASVQKHQRSANHHRYVFHHNEVSFEERRHYPGEEGVTGDAYLAGPSSYPFRSSSAAPPSPVPSARSTFDATEMDVDTKDGPLRVPRERQQSRPRTPTPPTSLQYGDVLYWHNLVAGGERCRPIDPRTRPVRVPERPGR